MVIIDPPKDPNGPQQAPQHLDALPPYTPVSPRISNSSFHPPLRSPGVRPSPSPFSAPPSNFLTIKREKADITGTWNINSSLPLPPSIARTTSGDSDTSSDAGTAITDARTSSASSSGATTASIAVPGSAARPNLKLLSPRGRIDAVIRVSGTPRAWIEAVSREEDVTISFPNPTSAPRAPIRLFARSTNGSVQVRLPAGFTGTLHVPSETALPASLKSLSVVLSPSEPPIERPPILDESPARTKLPRAPPSPPMTTIGDDEGGSYLVVPTVTGTSTAPSVLEEMTTAGPSWPPASTSDMISPLAPPRSEEAPPVDRTDSGGSNAGQGAAVEASTVFSQLPVETPAQENMPSTPPSIAPVGSRSLPPAPAVVISPTHNRSASAQELPSPPLSPPSVVMSPTQAHTHHRSVSADHRPASVLSTHSTHPASTSSTHLTTHHNRSSSNLTVNTTHTLRRTASNLSAQPTPATHSPSESSTIYFIGDYIRSGYDTSTPHKWHGDEFILDSEYGRVKILAHGEKVEAGWTEKVMEGWKGVESWKGVSEMGKMGKEMTKGMSEIGKGMQLSMPKSLGLSSLGRKFKLK
ncbi:hypothetical protein RhiJN_08172 [Ceratobasidium sp. AG-Ba]|nr:hypothetical protein RhiJN_08172 [Ceratobasidium sp. AG-Ba]